MPAGDAAAARLTVTRAPVALAAVAGGRGSHSRWRCRPGRCRRPASTEGTRRAGARRAFRGAGRGGRRVGRRRARFPAGASALRRGVTPATGVATGVATGGWYARTPALAEPGNARRRGARGGVSPRGPRGRPGRTGARRCQAQVRGAPAARGVVRGRGAGRTHVSAVEWGRRRWVVSETARSSTAEAHWPRRIGRGALAEAHASLPSQSRNQRLTPDASRGSDPPGL